MSRGQAPIHVDWWALASDLVTLSIEDGRSQWKFESATSSLLSALALPLESPLDCSHSRYFSETDPWRRHPDLGRLCVQLAERKVEQGRGGCSFGDLRPSYWMRDELAIQVSAASGRGIAFEGKCPSGTLLLREEAHAVVLYRAYHDTHCHFCIQPLRTFSKHDVKACSHCFEVYCSDACRARARICGHAAECTTNYAASVAPTALLCVRALLRVGLSCVENSGLVKADESKVAMQASAQDLQHHASSFTAQRLSQLRLHAYVGYRALRPAFDSRGVSEEQLLLMLCAAMTNVFLLSRSIVGTRTGRRCLEHMYR